MLGVELSSHHTERRAVGTGFPNAWFSVLFPCICHHAVTWRGSRSLTLRQMLGSRFVVPIDRQSTSVTSSLCMLSHCATGMGLSQFHFFLGIDPPPLANLVSSALLASLLVSAFEKQPGFG